MRVALINSNRKNHKKKVYFSVALLKLGAWLKSEGHKVELFDNTLPEAKQKFDEIWITTIFTFDVFYVKAMIESAKKICKVVRVGGISASLMPEFFRKLGVDVHVGLHPQAEKFPPDYSLLKTPPEYSISYTSRGCIRKCGFCMVKNLEPKFYSREWIQDISPLTTRVHFYDNNWLGKDKKDLSSDIKKLHKLVAEKKITEIDFNQSIDCRVMSEEIAKQLEGLPITPVRFAFDGMHEDKFYQKAVRVMYKYGFRHFVADYLYNFTDTPEDLYYRLRESAKLYEELKCPVKAFPMRFHPILELDTKRKHTGKHWSRQMLKGFRAVMTGHSPNGCMACTNIREFEYWFGKDEKEFVRILNYPQIMKLVNRKREYLRANRKKIIGVTKEKK